MATPRIFSVWRASRIFNFFNYFFSREIQLIFFHPLGVTLKNRSKVKAGLKVQKMTLKLE